MGVLTGGDVYVYMSTVAPLQYNFMDRVEELCRQEIRTLNCGRFIRTLFPLKRGRCSEKTDYFYVSVIRRVTTVL